MLQGSQFTNMITVAFMAMLTTVCITGCGGSSGPKPLSHHLEDKYLAAIPVSEKQQILEDQKQYHEAQAVLGKAEADLEEMKIQKNLADNDLKAAKLSLESANQIKKSAELSADMQRINDATANLAIANKEVEMRAAKLAYVKSQQAHLEAWQAAAKEDAYAKEARYEESKARLAHAKRIQPKDFTLAKYEDQARDRARSAEKAQQKVQDRQRKVEDAKRDLNNRMADLQQAKGAVTPPAVAPPTITPAVAPAPVAPPAVTIPVPESATTSP